MNKIKIMLMAVATFAVIGGALAFKSAKFGVKFCTNSVTYTNFPAAATTPTSLVGKLTNISSPAYKISVYYTPTTSTVLCPNVASLISLRTFITSIE